MAHTQEQKQSMEINSKIIQMSYLQGFRTKKKKKKDKDFPVAIKSEVKVMKEDRLIIASK